MKINTTRGRLLASTVLCGVMALAASAAQAQIAPAAPSAAAASPMTEIVVTGTRIKGVPNATSPSPISVTNSAQIAMTKADSIEEVLQHMTGADFTNGISGASNNGGVGLSAVSLRNLGPARALVLIDGQRLVSGFSGTDTVVDLNAVPLSMVDRIEVLRDGASSIYGADAIGGVINIITKKNANGMTADASYGQSGHGDGAVYSFSSSVGVDSDKGNVAIAIGWDHRDAIQGADRAWSTDPHVGAAHGEGGSVYRGQLNILQDEHSTAVWANGQQLDRTDSTVNWGAIDSALVYLPKAGTVKMSADKPDWNDLAGGSDRKQISFNSHYNLTDNLRFVAEGFFTNRKSNQSLRPEPLLGDTIATFVPGTTTTLFPGFVVPADAPGNTTGSAITAYLTPNQFGPRLYRQNVNTYRIRTGFEGTLFGKYDWEAGYVYQESSARADVLNEGNFNHLAQITEQISCVDVPGGCQAGTLQNGTTGMVPVVQPNWFNGPNKIFTQAQLNYLRFDNIDQNTLGEEYGYANISGPIWELPAGTLKGSIGAEIRRESLKDTPSELVQEGWAPNAASISGGAYNVESIYGELSIPLLKDLPFAEALTVTPSARYDHYSNFGGAYTNKVGVDYKIDQNIRIRSSFATGYRAPTTFELYGGQVVSDVGASGDPCDSRGAAYGALIGNGNLGQGILTAGSTCSLAVAGGAAVTNFQPAQDNNAGNQVQILEGGNPNLKPEQSESYGIGVVITPRWTPGLSFSADYYWIRISNAILVGGISLTFSPDIVLNGCYGATQNPIYCPLITRNATGIITQVNSLNTNFGTEKVQGIDYQLDYDTGAAHLTLPFPGTLHFDVQVSNLMKHSNNAPDGSSTNFAGTFNANLENIQPRWKGTAAVDYRIGPWTAHWDMQYYSHMKNFDGSAPVDGNEIPAMTYHNLSASYTFSDFAFMKKARVTLGIDNVADQDPPFISKDSICKCNTIGGPYDLVGRFFYGRVSASF